jgi:predicted nucleic acid-binding protein
LSKVLLDTNLYVDWLGRGLRPELLLGTDLRRYLSAVVLMELQVGATTRAAQRVVASLERAYAVGGRLIPPTVGVFRRAGMVLRRLRAQGREIRRASLVHDVLIALTGRAIGATVYTLDGSDFEAIRRCEDFSLCVVK